ncbi:hypothetical protein K488DRAFT_67538 [Vararia minispora EC-137]|uniref:Uncharacterized protein n=1 Tax=Vararia minispora EC-137 TaxID=1314806 RepID=A0ACB8QY97_9AGAM|nr:hypothetical protein K488DRAFT_67538 [Vararia minispora EC-137]
MPGVVSRDAKTSLTYFSKTADGGQPYNYTYEPPAGQPDTNIQWDTYFVTVHDARGRESEFNVDDNGFMFLKSPAKEKLFEDDEAITTGYYKEVEELLRKEVGAKRVVIFDHTIRRPRTTEDSFLKPQREPVLRVHVDQTPEAGVARVHRHLGAEAEHYLKGRSRIINVWRPIGNPVAHHPLAVADFRSVNREELVTARHIYQDREGSTFSIKHSPSHKWYYLADQTPDEVILIKCWDSDLTKSLLAAHTAFTDNTSPADAPDRQSIEVRCLVFDQE